MASQTDTMADATETLDTSWQGGKFAGSIVRQRDSRSYLFKYGTYHKTFTWKDGIRGLYDKRDKALKAAKEYRIQYNLENDLIRNQWRYVTYDIIEVKLTQGKTMITNAKYLHIVEKYTWCASKGKGDLWYAATDTRTGFHRIITGYPLMVDHIDGICIVGIF